MVCVMNPNQSASGSLVTPGCIRLCVQLLKIMLPLGIEGDSPDYLSSHGQHPASDSEMSGVINHSILDFGTCLNRLLPSNGDSSGWDTGSGAATAPLAPPRWDHLLHDLCFSAEFNAHGVTTFWDAFQCFPAVDNCIPGTPISRENKNTTR